MVYHHGSPPSGTVVVIGAGVFGTSTAYYLSRSNPRPARIIIVDSNPFPPPPASSAASAPSGASYDINKIVRADYSVPFYMELGYEAMDVWSSSPLLKPFYHQTGWLMLDEKGSDLAERIRKNFRNTSRRDPTSDMSLAKVREAWGGMLREADMKKIGSAYCNSEAGWVEADKAVEAMLKDAVGRGVQYVQGNVVEFLACEPPKRGIKGVKLAGGAVIEADKVLLATGAWTSQLMSKLEDELNIEDELRVEQQVKAAGVCVAHYKLDKEEKKRYDKMPVIINGADGDIQPPPPSGFLKFTNSRTFTNTMVTLSNHTITAPPAGPQSNVPQDLKSETIDIIHSIMPSMKRDNRTATYWRLCWDAITPTQDHLITRHPDERLTNLYFAVGGSFHSWKFLPITGKFVTNVLQGVSNGEERDLNWGWKRAGWSSGGARGAHEKVVPERELRSLEETSR